MKKEDILALIEAAMLEAKFALEREDISLTDKEKKLLEDYIIKIENHKSNFAKVDEADQELMESYYKAFKMALSDLVSFRRKKEIEAGINSDKGPSEKAKSDGTKSKEGNDKLVVTTTKEIDKPKKGELVKTGHKIIDVIPEKEQPDHTKNERDILTKVLRGIFYVLGSAAAVALIAAAIKYCVDHPNGRELPDVPTTTPSSSYSSDRLRPGWTTDDLPVITAAPQIVNRIGDININDYDELMEYATQIQSELKGEASSKISIYDIIKAIKMANWDLLEDKSVFDNRESVVRSTYNEGLIASELGSDAIVQKDVNSDIFITKHQMTDILMCVTDNKLSIDCFDCAKVDDRGYDIYAVIDTCISGMNKHVDSEVEEEIEQDRLYAMVFNDVVSRAVRNFTIVNSDEALVSTIYYVLGTFNATLPRNIELTAGRSYGTAYGNGHENDGGYGDICIEELSSALYIVHESTNQYTGNDQACIFYGDFIDKALIEPYQGQSLGLN